MHGCEIEEQDWGMYPTRKENKNLTIKDRETTNLYVNDD